MKLLHENFHLRELHENWFSKFNNSLFTIALVVECKKSPEIHIWVRNYDITIGGSRRRKAGGNSFVLTCFHQKVPTGSVHLPTRNSGSATDHHGLGILYRQLLYSVQLI